MVERILINAYFGCSARRISENEQPYKPVADVLSGPGAKLVYAKGIFVQKFGETIRGCSRRSDVPNHGLSPREGPRNFFCRRENLPGFKVRE